MAESGSLDIASPQSAIARFRQLLLADNFLAERLGEIEHPDVFIAAALAIASERRTALTADDLESALQRGAGQKPLAPEPLDCWPAQGWAPGRSARGCTQPAFDWFWPGRQSRFTSFYEDRVRCAWNRPLNRLVRARTSLDQLVAGAVKQEAERPDGFIFHMSRCGSTLLARLLAQLEGSVVLSEPEPLDALVQWAGRADLPRANAALQAMVTALGRGLSGRKSRFFIKLDSWHAPALPLFRAAFPGVPWLFLYRNPVEVMASHLSVPGRHVARGVLADEILGIEASEFISREDYCARALAKICGAVLDNWRPDEGLLVNYSEIQGAIPKRVCDHFGLEPTQAESTAVAAAATLHSKSGANFTSDRIAKRAAASGQVRKAVREHLLPVFHRLEDVRLD
jgi:hypothetical protein